MAATDQTYRSQRTLDIVFGVSNILMLICVIWMFVADFNREWKPIQRKFRDVETVRNQRLTMEKLPKADSVKELSENLAARRKALTDAKKKVQTEESKRKAELNLATVNFQTWKAEVDAASSRVDYAYEVLGEAKTSAEQAAVKKDIDAKEKKVKEMQAKLDEAKVKLQEAEANYRKSVRDEPIEGIECKLKIDGKEVVKEHPNLKDFELALSQADDELKKVTGLFDRFGKVTAQKGWKLSDTIRALPIMDAFASPTRINQIALPDLTIEYGSFKEVPRYDRCTTCHLAADRATFDKESLRALTSAPEAMQKQLDESYAMFRERAARGEDLGFNPSDLPTVQPMAWLRWLPIGLGLIGSIVFCLFRRSLKWAIAIFVLGAVLTLIMFFALPLIIAPKAELGKVNLSPGEVTEYCVHPRLDLFVDSNSPHPAEKFGCTTCHAGQGSATDFTLASHSPNDAFQSYTWKRGYEWYANHDWEFPMLPSRFVEASCLKCHHEVTDLIRDGVKEEAPKLLKGYNLIRENGCFGCHEIAGMKGERSVGPDMRLEPSPALDLQSPGEQNRIKSDPLNPPGTYRKVGPGLRRIAEKLSGPEGEKWTRKWIQSPRGFRDDTKMPHFYGQGTNSPEALPADQKEFPAAEIHAITHYLFHESKGHLGIGDSIDNAHKALFDTLDSLGARLKVGALEDKERKELVEATRQLNDLALLSHAAKAREIHSEMADLQAVQNRFFEYYRRGATDEAEQKALGAELDIKLAALKRISRAVKLSRESILDSEGKTITKEQWTGLDSDKRKPEEKLANGRQQFVQKGCLACHSHAGTETAGKNSIVSEANFGPNLSRIAGKIKNDTEGKLWLTQWLLNPNVHHSRTRMPVVHLSLSDATDIMEWLLSQKGDDVQKWMEEKDVLSTDGKAPELATYVQLARVYLSKAPGVSIKDLDAFLPEGTKTVEELKIKGIPADRVKTLPRDADERWLESGKVDENSLKWYIGKKSIGRLGCYACHDVPGFETAKPIGVGLQDWGKKDAARLAFEDSVGYVKEHYKIEPLRLTETQVKNLDRDERTKTVEAEIKKLADKANGDGLDAAELSAIIRLQEELEALRKAGPMTKEELADLDKLKRLQPWSLPKSEGEGESAHGGKRPYEQYFFDALEHHSRDGFLNLKLADPRSYDFNRRRSWDDRLRMPHFQFARSRKKTGETDEAYALRHSQEEAEAREAVMTFILGLVAEPINPKYLANPNPDRLNEIKGRQVLDKFNCAGCHQLRAGIVEVSPGTTSLVLLQKAHDKYLRLRGDDYEFPNHNAWVGASPSSEKVLLRGVDFRTEVADPDDRDPTDPTNPTPSRFVRLTTALRFTGVDRIMRDLPAGETASFNYKDLVSRMPPLGGTFAELMIPYLPSVADEYKDKSKSRNVLPPPLLREGERVQPKWLHGFLLDPQMIRPQTLLRMPRFNMSPEDATALVNYFAAVDRQANPGAGITYPYVDVPQSEPEFWTRKSAEYWAKLKPEARKLRQEQMGPLWDLVLVDQVAEAQRKVGGAEEDLKKAEAYFKSLKDADPNKVTAKAGLDKATGVLADEKKKLADLQKQPTKERLAGIEKRWQEREVYAADGYRLLLAHENGICIGCHKVGSIGGAQGPALDLAAARLRPEWTRLWISNPVRMFPYAPTMSQNLPNHKVRSQDLFEGGPDLQIMGLRDVLLDLPRVSELPADRYYRLAPVDAKK